VLTRALHLLPPERAHRLAILGLGQGFSGLGRRVDPGAWPRLATRLAGLDLPSPLGLAAGFDKNAEALPGLAKLGFGWLETGTITPRPQRGNPQPRLFRLAEDRALINRLGFNNRGLEAAKAKLAARRPAFGIVGANIGANKDSEDPVDDYVQCLEALYRLADYFTINVSSPNTPGLRLLQGRARLDRLLDALTTLRAALSQGRPRKPLFLKIAPDLQPEDEADIAEVALARGIDALIISNTTLDRPAALSSTARGETGGLSGRPLFERSTAELSRFSALTGGRLPLIGVGGIDSGATALAKLRAGASALQLYTGFVYGGPGLIRKILAELDALLGEHGYSSVAEAVGSAPTGGAA
jgi:dihydroorotate dehydrogenase